MNEALRPRHNDDLPGEHPLHGSHPAANFSSANFELSILTRRNQVEELRALEANLRRCTETATLDCLDCGQPIPETRLEATNYTAQRCIPCLTRFDEAKRGHQFNGGRRR